ncbi:MAG: hypothetical protein QG570_170 [Patescibacteria group bacterium]|nr:hypothetical protein [Patescibacteria group bacterium]
MGELRKVKRILIVDDNEFFAKVIKSELLNHGYEVDIVYNGEQALDFLKHTQVDLILLDIIMPIKDGFETMEEIKKNELTKNISVVFFSNLGQAEDIQKAMNMGAQSYIVKKDFSLKEVMDNIETHIRKSDSL